MTTPRRAVPKSGWLKRLQKTIERIIKALLEKIIFRIRALEA